MGKFGFGNDDEEIHNSRSGLVIEGLDKKKKARLKTSDKEAILSEGEALGFKRREPKDQRKKLKRKPGRKAPTEPRGQILIGGPQTTIEEFKQWCEDNGDIPYWEGLRDLIDIARK